MDPRGRHGSIYRFRSRVFFAGSSVMTWAALTAKATHAFDGAAPFSQPRLMSDARPWAAHEKFISSEIGDIERRARRMATRGGTRRP
jgi:hypothetical protein